MVRKASQEKKLVASAILSENSAGVLAFRRWRSGIQESSQDIPRANQSAACVYHSSTINRAEMNFRPTPSRFPHMSHAISPSSAYLITYQTS